MPTPAASLRQPWTHQHSVLEPGRHCCEPGKTPSPVPGHRASYAPTVRALLLPRSPRGWRAGDVGCAGSRPSEEHARIKLSVLRGSVQPRDAACETKDDRQAGGDQQRALLFMATCADRGTRRKLFPPSPPPEVLQQQPGFG